VTQQEAFMGFIAAGKHSFFVPVPLHPERFRIRGYNQAELLAKELSFRLGIPSLNVLVREKPTKPQFKLKREERMKNVIGVFTVSKKLKTKVKGANIILIDDITTTGSTLRECAKILKKSGVKKYWG
jgi:ComF family protein